MGTKPGIDSSQGFKQIQAIQASEVFYIFQAFFKRFGYVKNIVK